MEKSIYVKEVNDILNKYNVSKKDRDNIWNIIYPVFIHKEFQKRMDASKYPHHDTISLGHHIISDAIISYLWAKKYQKKHSINVEITVLIAMFHDLYELPWQNANKKNKFLNVHGFRHPIESAINAVSWYPKYFKDLNQSEIIIDGILHHMWPLPVRLIDTDIESLELNNVKKWYKLDDNIKKIIISSTMRSHFLHLSFCKSKFKEGRIMSKADKYISLIKDINFSGVKSCITGKNAKLKKYHKKDNK